MLASKKMERQDFAGAQSLLDSLPAEPSYDRAAMQATLYRKQGKRSEAAKLLESRLLHRANDCYTALLSLAEIAFEEGDGALADTLAVSRLLEQGFCGTALYEGADGQPALRLERPNPA